MMKTHRPALLVAGILSLGIMLGKYVSMSLRIWMALCAIGLMLSLWKKFSWALWAAVLTLGALLMAQRNVLPVNSIVFLNEEAMEQVEAIQGMVEANVQTGQGKVVVELSVRQLCIHDIWQPSSGKLRLNLYGNQEDVLEYGNIVRINGKLKPIHDWDTKNSFSYRQYLQDRGIYGNFVAKEGGIKVLSFWDGNYAMKWALQLRQYMEDIFARYLSQREVAFVAALVLGDRSNMAADVKEIFVNTGTAHILAISGMNMAIITAVFFFILRLCFVSRHVHFWGTIIFLFAYAFLSGWSASVVRACIMSALILASFALEFESDALNSLGLAALLLLLMDPRNLFDVGFQLSFAAVFGILTLFNPCKKLFFFCPRFIADSMALSLAAWVTTVVIILYHFRIITPISILANIPIVPMADLVMALGLGLAWTGGWCPWLGYAFAGCLKALLSAMIISATWFNQIPWGHFNFN